MTAVVFLSVKTPPLVKRYGYFNLGLDEGHYPVGASLFIKEHQLPANLFNSYSWGGYLMWELFPEYLVFWDSRATSAKMFHIGQTIQYGKAAWQEYVDTYDVNTMVIKPLGEDKGSRFELIDILRKDQAWSLVYADENSLVFVRNDSVDLQWLNAYRLPETRIDDTILTAAQYLLSRNGGAYRAFGEAANVYLSRGQYRKGLELLGLYLERCPEEDVNARRIYEQLQNRFSLGI